MNRADEIIYMIRIREDPRGKRVVSLKIYKKKVSDMKKYDYLIVGAGLFGAVFAHEATRRGKTCLVIDKRDHIGGNIYTEEVEGIQVHRYGAVLTK